MMHTVKGSRRMTGVFHQGVGDVTEISEIARTRDGPWNMNHVTTEQAAVSAGLQILIPGQI